MAFDVQAALERTGLPTSRSTIRRQGDEDNLLPDIYLIYSEMLVPGDFFDDRYHAMLHHVTVHICSAPYLPLFSWNIDCISALTLAYLSVDSCFLR